MSGDFRMSGKKAEESAEGKAERQEFIKNSVVLRLWVRYNIGVAGCLLEDDYIRRHDYLIQKGEDP